MRPVGVMSRQRSGFSLRQQPDMESGHSSKATAVLAAFLGSYGRAASEIERVKRAMNVRYGEAENASASLTSLLRFLLFTRHAFIIRCER